MRTTVFQCESVRPFVHGQLKNAHTIDPDMVYLDLVWNVINSQLHLTLRVQQLTFACFMINLFEPLLTIADWIICLWVRYLPAIGQ